MANASRQLRASVRAGEFLYMPSVYSQLQARIVQDLGFRAAFLAEHLHSPRENVKPAVTITERVQFALRVVAGLDIPLLVPVGMGWRNGSEIVETIREFIAGGIAGIQLEDCLISQSVDGQYHEQAIPFEEYMERLEAVCRKRDLLSPDFVVIASAAACRTRPVEEAANRINEAAAVGADIGLLFPSSPKDVAHAPKLAHVPLVYWHELGVPNRPLVFSPQELKNMGYAGCIEVPSVPATSFDRLSDFHDDSGSDSPDQNDWIKARQRIQELIGLYELYEFDEGS